MKKIGNITKEDVNDLLFLAEKAHNESSYSKYNFVKDYALNIINEIINNPNEKFGIKLEINNKIIGFFVGKIVNIGFCDLLIGMDDGFYIEKEYRGSKAAFLMFIEFKKWCIMKKAIPAVFIHYANNNEKTYEFCKKMGMIEKGKFFIDSCL